MKKFLTCLLFIPAMARAEFFTGNDLIYFVYPDKGPVWFLLTMLGVIALAIWVGVKEK